MDNILQTKKDLENANEIEREKRRNRIIQIFSELLDEEILERVKANKIIDFIYSKIRKGEVVNIGFSCDKNQTNYTYDFNFNYILINKCYVPTMVFWKKQTRYMDIDLKNWLDWLKEYNGLGSYVDLTKSIVDNSEQFKILVDDLKNKGFDVVLDCENKDNLGSSPKLTLLIS